MVEGQTIGLVTYKVKIKWFVELFKITHSSLAHFAE